MRTAGSAGAIGRGMWMPAYGITHLAHDTGDALDCTRTDSERLPWRSQGGGPPPR